MTDLQPSQQSPSQRSFFDGDPKTLFYFGLVLGMAIVLLFNSFAGLSYGSGAGSTATAQKTANTAASASPSAPTNTDPRLYATGKMPEVTSADHVRGDLNKAKVVIVEYSDLQCPFCSRHHPTLKKLFEAYGDQVAWVYRHFPLNSIHPNARPAAIASECAGEQGKFWEFIDATFNDNATMNGDAAAASALYQKIAKDIKLDSGKFSSCLSSGKYDSVVDSQQDGGESLQVQGTPATFFNGQMVQTYNPNSASWGSAGAASYATLQKLLDAELAKKK